MKTPYLCFSVLLLSLLFSCSAEKKEPGLVFHPPILTAEWTDVSYLDSTWLIRVDVTLTNATLVPVKFMSMSCGYEKFFFTESAAEFEISPLTICFRNFPVTRSIPPGGKYKRTLLIRQKAAVKKITQEKIRIGMQFIEPWEIISRDAFFQDPFSFGRLIWSNEIDLNPAFDKVAKAKLDIH